MREFFGIGGYTREPQGAYSWQHLTFVGFLIISMLVGAILSGILLRKSEMKVKNRVLIICAISINAVELVKIIAALINSDDIWHTILHLLPLFLCSIQLITIPLAAFTKGRIKEACLDFVLIFGLLGGILGTVGAAQNYNAYPVLSIDNVASGITHTISGFASIYIASSGMISLKKRSIGIAYAILSTFVALALLVNLTSGSTNYMFLMSHDGTPYSIIYNMVGGNKIIYPILVILIFVVYIIIFYLVAMLVRHIKAKKQAKKS